MRINRIVTTSIKLSNKNEDHQYNQINKPSVSKIPFKGYMSVQSEYLCPGTSGATISEYKVDKGWHSNIKKLTTIKEMRVGPGDSGNFNYGVYFADINEVVDKDKLPWGANFLVEYVKPNTILFSDIKKSFNNSDSQGISFNDTLSYSWAWKELYQREYDEIIERQKFKRDEHSMQMSEIEKRLLSDRLFFLAQEINTYEQLNALVNKSSESLILRKNHSCLEYVIKNCENSIAEKKSAITKKQTEITMITNATQKELDLAKEEYNNASDNDKEEYQTLITLKKIQQAQQLLKIEEIKKQIEELLNEITALEKLKNSKTNEKEKIENNPVFINSNTFLANILEQIRKIYAEKLPNNIGE